MIIASPTAGLHGIDVSHHNRPDWADVAGSSAFVYCRATYGTARDRLVREHVSAARDFGLRVGLYGFYRPSQPAQDQADAFLQVAAWVGIRDGDLVHALDVEADVKTPVVPAWEPGVRTVAELLSEAAGSPCMVYCTRREWTALGDPLWLSSHPLWVADWRGPAEPRTPLGMGWAIHQYRVGPYAPLSAHAASGVTAKGALDHNRARMLPTIQTGRKQRQSAKTAVPMVSLRSDYQRANEARDKWLRERDDES
jgi:hypothetical protein